MLKTDVIESEKQIRFVLYGKLFEPWVPGLTVIWQEKQESFAGREVIVDLREMTAVDAKGRALLSRMQDAGARFLTSGVLTKFLVESMRKRKTQNADGAIQGEQRNSSR